jgi:hypothetical protein
VQGDLYEYIELTEADVEHQPSPDVIPAKAGIQRLRVARKLPGAAIRGDNE